jgi:ubiquinone/menaquinone biosynthesis C-methylase UbiE
MFDKTPEFYDKIYSFKDYEDEARKLCSLIQRESPSAHTILDVACGTAAHGLILSRKFAVDGLDLQPEFVEVARKKLPKGSFIVADMRAFDMEKHYDVVQCLFSSIGYLLSGDDVVQALSCFKRHLNPGGVIFVEPWFTPAQWSVGRPWMTTYEEPELKICRMNVSERTGDISVLRFHYMVADPTGVHRFDEVHQLKLYSEDEMLSFFSRAGLQATFDPEGIFGRGMYTARVAVE